MDPDANIEEQIKLLEIYDGGWAVPADAARYQELVEAYRDWRNMGGFPAGDEQLLRLEAKKQEVFGKETEWTTP